jgi:hypothetical protein
MATVTPTRKFDHAETRKRVQHPLQLVRSYIRRYIILEGAALLLLCASILFWVGLACDFGLFKFEFDILGVYGVDWILELNEMDATGVASVGCRIVVFTVIVIGLVTLFFTKVVWRWIREFNDRAVALVLERRFPKQLGDRLITAVELADPKLAEKYGYSQAMVEKTIQEAVDTIKTLPVASVFNWRRLYGMWALVGVSTLGMLIVTMAVVCVTSIFTETEAVSPVGFAWRFYDVSAIWTERSVMMKNSYWPRRAQLEVVNFHRSKDDPNDMRIARDDPKKRPDLQVRAIEWVIADRDPAKAPYGWRPLTWADLKEHHLVDEKVLNAVTIPVDFEFWAVDTDELEPALRNALFGENAKAAPATSGAMRENFKLPEQQQKIAARQAASELDQWLDWQHWTVDKLALQKENTDVRTPLRNLVRPGDDHYQQLEAVFSQLKEKTDSPMWSRTVRQLQIPTEVVAGFRGESKSFGPHALDKMTTGNKWLLPLDELTESPRFKLRVRGENYFTPAKQLTLVPATMPKSITIDKEEPAYIYFRLDQMDQSPLAGKKHRTNKFPQSSGGNSNIFEVPLGSDLTINVETDRKLHPERSAFTEKSPVSDPNFDAFRGTITIHPDKTGFSIAMTNITRNHDFMVEFFDEDNIRGERRFKIIRTLDSEPVLGNLNVFDYIPRKPRFKPPTVDKDGKPDYTPSRDQAEMANAFLITPNALIPFECAIKDDHGLVHVGYQYKYRVVDFELIAQGNKKPPTLKIDEAKRRSRLGNIVSNFQYWPGNPMSWLAAAAHISASAEILDLDLRAEQKYKSGYIPSAAFQDQLERRQAGFINMAQFNKGDAKQMSGPWEFDLKDTNDGFDVKRHLKDLKTADKEAGYLHYLLQIAVQAGDNNVETGQDYIHVYETEVNGVPTIRKVPLRGNTKKNANGYVNFLVVTENELLSQIALDEEVLLEKLEAAKDKVDAGMTSILEQQSKTQLQNPEMKNIAIRMNEIRTALSSAGNTVREAQAAYDNISKEMRANRVDPARMSNIENNIIRRLDLIVKFDPNVPGSDSLQKAEDAFAAAHELVEKEANAGSAPNIEAHRQNMNAAHLKMQRLSSDINSVLVAMSQGITESKAIAILVTIEQIQRSNTRVLQLIHDEILEKLLRELTEPDKDKKKDKQTPETKQEGKKVGQLQDAKSPDLDRALAAVGPRSVSIEGAATDELGISGDHRGLRILPQRSQRIQRRIQEAKEIIGDFGSVSSVVSVADSCFW